LSTKKYTATILETKQGSDIMKNKLSAIVPGKEGSFANCEVADSTSKTIIASSGKTTLDHENFKREYNAVPCVEEVAIDENHPEVREAVQHAKESFIDAKFECDNGTLMDLMKKITDKKLAFHPYLALEAIKHEIETQLKDIIVNHFKGMTIEQLGICSSDINSFAKAEEERWTATLDLAKHLAIEKLKSEMK
jgi:hypothetical protein